jgi:hypothetical protein
MANKRQKPQRIVAKLRQFDGLVGQRARSARAHRGQDGDANRCDPSQGSGSPTALLGSIDPGAGPSGRHADLATPTRRGRFPTFDSCHPPPSRQSMPCSFNAAVMPLSEVTPRP